MSVVVTCWAERQWCRKVLLVAGSLSVPGQVTLEGQAEARLIYKLVHFNLGIKLIGMGLVSLGAEAARGKE